MASQIPKIDISKIDAAKKQLETAIMLYFQYADPVSIHTLAGAAYDILHALCKVREIKAFIKNTEIVRKGKEKEYLKMLNEAQNFFKHAGRDPDASYEFWPRATDYFIWDACQMYKKITNEMPKAFFIFDMWFTLNNADLVTNKSYKQTLKKGSKVFSMDNKTDFYQEASTEYDHLLSKGLLSPSQKISP